MSLEDNQFMARVGSSSVPKKEDTFFQLLQGKGNPPCLWLKFTLKKDKKDIVDKVQSIEWGTDLQRVVGVVKPYYSLTVKEFYDSAFYDNLMKQTEVNLKKLRIL